MNETEKRVPAPDRDLQNVPPQIPPASRDLSPVTRGTFATLAIGLGAAIFVLAVLAVAFGIAPLPQRLLADDDVAAWVLVGLSGLGFVGSGFGILRRSLAAALLLLILAVLCGWSASAIT